MNNQEKDSTAAFLYENNFTWTIGIDFEAKNKKKINHFEGIYEKCKKDFAKIL